MYIRPYLSTFRLSKPLHSLDITLPIQPLPQILRTLDHPISRRELINHILERFQRAERIVTREMVLRLRSASGNTHGTVVVSDSHVVLFLH